MKATRSDRYLSARAAGFFHRNPVAPALPLRYDPPCLQTIQFGASCWRSARPSCSAPPTPFPNTLAPACPSRVPVDPLRAVPGDGHGPRPPRRPRRSLHPRNPGLQVARGICVVLSSILFVYGVRRMTMAQATTINFLSPILITILSVPLLGETVARDAGPRSVPGCWACWWLFAPASAASSRRRCSASAVRSAGRWR